MDKWHHLQGKNAALRKKDALSIHDGHCRKHLPKVLGQMNTIISRAMCVECLGEGLTKREMLLPLHPFFRIRDVL